MGTTLGWPVRFLSQVRQGHPDECWPWLAYTNPAGYGRVAVPGRGKQYVHRIAYELAHGAIPDGLTVDHLCRNRGCCNPAHLEAVTRADNIRRGGKSLQTHCIHGHSLADAYVDRRAGGISRKCRPCHVQRVRMRHARLSAERSRQRVECAE